MRHPLLAAALAAAVLAAPAARADIPPDPNSPDAHCTPAEQCPKGSVSCPYSFHPGAPPPAVPEGQACRTDALAKGLERRCRNGGNYSGTDLFCPKGASGSWGGPGGKSRCAFAPPGHGSGGWAWLVLAAAVVVRLSAKRR